MAKKKQAKEEPKEESQKPEEKALEEKLPKEAREKLAKIKVKLEEFQKKVVDKFGDYIMGVELLPPEKPKEGEKPDTNKINVLVLVDDRDSKKMSKEELRDKLGEIIAEMAKEIDKNLSPMTIILSELWQNCYDANYELLEMMAMGAPVYDKGMLAAIKITEIHKKMALQKFEKYIVSYVLFGSLVRGEATPESDIDVAIIIDDTDVKKMTRAELKDKLRAIIIGMGMEAGSMTGIQNKLNIQVYILTDFWDSLKEANPVIFTILRDGIPFYDRGIFMPWKQLLQMGKIKPSPEAIDMFMSSGDEMLKRVHYKLKDIGMEDVFWSILTPSQAALMHYGIPPPTPRETPKLLREMFVKKEKILEDKYVKILEDAVEIRKQLEHGTKKEVTGKEVDDLLKNGEEFLERIKKLFKEIDEMKEKESIRDIYESTLTIIRDIMRMEDIEKAKDVDEIRTFKSEVINKGLVPEKYLRMLDEIVGAKKKYDEGKLTKTEVEKVRKTAREFTRFMIEYMQRKRGRELERTKIRVKHGNRYGEVILMGKSAYIIHDIDNEEKEISKAEIKTDGSLGTPQSSSLEDMEKDLIKIEMPEKSFIKQPIFEDLKKIFGKDVEILVNY